MSTNKILERVTKNWKAKIICFVIALIFYYFNQVSTLDRRTVSVPLSIVENGSMTCTNGADRPRYVKVTFRGKNEYLAGITENDLKAFVDISSQTKEGRYAFPVLIQLNERLMLMEPLEITSSPETVSLSVEQRIFRFVGIEPTYNGEPAYGFECSGSEIVPPTVRISGPRSMVESISSIYTDGIDINGAESDVTATVALVNTNSLITLDGDEKVQVTSSIVQKSATKTFTDVPVRFENIPENMEIEGGARTISVTLEGNMLDMDNVTKDRIFVYADCSRLDGSPSAEVPVFVSVSGGSKVVSWSDESLDVQVSVKKIEVPEEEGEPETETEGGDEVEETPAVLDEDTESPEVAAPEEVEG